jgi:hypothetical protein
MEGYQKPCASKNWDKALWELTVVSRESGLAERLGEFNLSILVITGDDCARCSKKARRLDR